MVKILSGREKQGDQREHTPWDGRSWNIGAPAKQPSAYCLWQDIQLEGVGAA